MVLWANSYACRSQRGKGVVEECGRGDLFATPILNRVIEDDKYHPQGFLKKFLYEV